MAVIWIIASNRALVLWLLDERATVWPDLVAGMACGWMLLAQRQQGTPQVHGATTVELQTSDGRTAGCRKRENGKAVRAPSKVLAPAIAARMIEGGRVAGGRIKSATVILFAVVAILAREGKVLEVVRAAGGKRLNVVHGE